MQLRSIYEYYDYRKYLLDFYEAKKAHSSWYSYRYMAQKIGIDHAYLIRILQGQRHIPLKSASNCCELLGLSTRKAEYWELMVLFSRAKSDRESKHYLEKMLAFSETPVRQVDAAGYEFYQHWYYTAIRELLNIHPFDGDYEKLASMLHPPIRPSEAKKAIKLLERLNFIRVNPSGRYELTSQFITTGEAWRTLAVRQFQKDTIGLAVDALESLPKEERNISTVTVSMDSRNLDQVHELVRKFHEDVLTLARTSRRSDRVYQINCQVFPLSQRVDVAGGEGV